MKSVSPLKLTMALAGLSAALLFAANSARSFLKQERKDRDADPVPLQELQTREAAGSADPASRPAVAALDLAPRMAAAFQTNAFVSRDPFEAIAASYHRLEEERTKLERARAELLAQSQPERSIEPSAASRPAAAPTAPRAPLHLRGVMESGARSVALVGAHIVGLGQDVPGTKFTLQSVSAGKAVFAGPSGIVELTPPLGTLHAEVEESK